MKVYISGKITNEKDYKRRFQMAEDLLRGRGYEVVNPARNHEDSYKAYIDTGLRQLSDCDMIYMLKGWRNSTGAYLELTYADAVGLKIWYE